MKIAIIISLLLVSCTLTRAPKTQVECHCVTQEADRRDGHDEEDEQKTDAKVDAKIPVKPGGI